MYMKYNAVLRAQSGDHHLVEAERELCRGNKYATSIHATNSCVLKLSKLTKACKVYRGIKDAALPKSFWVPNEMGVRAMDGRDRTRGLPAALAAIAASFASAMLLLHTC